MPDAPPDLGRHIWYGILYGLLGGTVGEFRGSGRPGTSSPRPEAVRRRFAFADRDSGAAGAKLPPGSAQWDWYVHRARHARPRVPGTVTREEWRSAAWQ